MHHKGGLSLNSLGYCFCWEYVKKRLATCQVSHFLPLLFSSLSSDKKHLFFSSSGLLTQLMFVCVVMSVLLPSGGYKGYGLGMMVEVFCGILAGAQYSNHVRTWKVTDKVANLVRSHVCLFILACVLCSKQDVLILVLPKGSCCHIVLLSCLWNSTDWEVGWKLPTCNPAANTYI